MAYFSFTEQKEYSHDVTKYIFSAKYEKKFSQKEFVLCIGDYDDLILINELQSCRENKNKFID
jgi:hypothetical protein